MSDNRRHIISVPQSRVIAGNSVDGAEVNIVHHGQNIRPDDRHLWIIERRPGNGAILRLASSNAPTSIRNDTVVAIRNGPAEVWVLEYQGDEEWTIRTGNGRGHWASDDGNGSQITISRPVVSDPQRVRFMPSLRND